MLLLCLLTLQFLCIVDCYPNGAPTGACKDMMPQHAGVVPQTSPAPYTILTNMKRYLPGMPVTVTIIGPQYRGVLLEARREHFNDAYGSWKIPPPDTKFLQCSGNPQGAITHANTNLKSNTTVYTWIPHDIMHPVYFMATVAQQRTVYWINVRSNILPSEDLGGLKMATNASAGIAEENPLLLFLIYYLLIQILG
ncbi:putative defense protein Hdd11-like [Xiphophorus maculatus]|uniref:Putative defense protein Hdd11-like n=1 Tax=Xiphophorus maculatus TaxID=8083 RepID=M4ARM3_XIPMA|nr:putative defense protein Hdd11-like [Xiphophorus maculatus]XP_027890880.1 putative defense protein Hdd11-like [Xiphophorus couchianus]